ncbi:MAG: class I SAM-dependent methyltransferase [Clostridiales bacterium]|nr:class I SAM-dependent methyltransferase [Clostridiales bacterium]
MKIILFGCGQGGQMVRTWLPAHCQLLAYADNNPDKWGSNLDGIPVIPPDGIPGLAPDLVFITVLNREASHSIEEQLRKTGFRGQIRTLHPFRETMDLRLSHLRLLAREIRDRCLPGAVAELGVYRGEFAAEINRLFPDRTLYLFDTFQGFTQTDVDAEKEVSAYSRASAGDFADTSTGQVLSRLPHPERAVLCEGHFPDTLPADLPPFAFVSLDPDLYAPAYEGLCVFWPLLVPGGAILIHDYNSTQFEGVGKAVRRFCREQNLTVLPLSDLHGSAVLMKQMS